MSKRKSLAGSRFKKVHRVPIMTMPCPPERLRALKAHAKSIETSSSKTKQVFDDALMRFKNARKELCNAIDDLQRIRNHCTSEQAKELLEEMQRLCNINERNELLRYLS